MADVTNTFYPGKAFVGYKAQLLVGQGGTSPETYVAVADLTMIEPGSTPAATVNKTHLRSPGRAHEKIATIRELNPWKFSGNYRPDHGSHSLDGGDGFSVSHSLPSLHRSLAEASFQIKVVDSDGTTHTIEFDGVVTDYKVGQIVLDQRVEFTCEIQPLVDWTDGLP